MEELLHWLEVRISSSLRPRADDIKALLLDHSYRSCLSEFLKNEDVHVLYIYFKLTKSSLAASLTPPPALQNKCICFIKLGAATKLTLENIANSVITVDCAKFPLKYIDMVLHQVYLPLLCNDNMMAGKDLSTDKIIDILHRFTGNLEVMAGHAEGSIVLPIPSLEILRNPALSNKRGFAIHILETTVIGWIRQIKVVLKHDPLTELKMHGPKAGIYHERDMWKSHIYNLQSISSQLSSAEAREIVTNLEQVKSTYGHSITAVTRDVNKALLQAEENVSFLKTLLQWYDQLKTAKSAAERQNKFLPLLHSLYLVWTHSRYYHQSKVFLNLLKLMSNGLIDIAGSLLGNNILETPQAYNLLKEALKICATFRGTYLDVKVKADEMNSKKNAENASQMFMKPPDTLWRVKMYGPLAPKFSDKDWMFAKDTKHKDEEQEVWVDSPWPQHNASCFQNMNMFMERCNDVLDLVETMKHFQVLKTVAAIGGAGASSSDAMVQEIWDMYCTAKENFINRITDIFAMDKNSPFEKAFFDFRTSIKHLEHQLGSILRGSFDQCPTIASQLRLLEVFDGISRRDVVKDHLKDKDHQLVSMCIAELTQVNDMYQEMADSPPLLINMTPTVSKLFWIKGLKTRISDPMMKLRTVSPISLEGDMGWKLRHLYKETLAQLERFEISVMTSWLSAVDKEVNESMKLPLLRCAGVKSESEKYLYKIELNLNPELLVLLREVDYLLKPPFMITLPEYVGSLMRSLDINKLKMLSARLEIVVSKYNEFIKTVSHQQMSLFEKKLLKINEILKDGMNFYTWSMDESTDYTELATSYIYTDLHTNFSTVTNNYKVITELSAAWCNANLDIFTCRDVTKSYSITELITTQKHLEQELGKQLISDGQKIHSLVHQSFVATGISEASPAWQDYIMHIDDLILQGLKKVTVTSLAALLNTLLDFDHFPILCIQVDLINSEVAFNPSLDQCTSDESVMEHMEEWLKAFLLRGSYIKGLSYIVKEGYQEYISGDEEALQLIGHVLQQVEKGVLESQAQLEVFTNYAFLWKKDVNAEFQNFLYGKQSINSSLDKDGTGDEMDTVSKSLRSSSGSSMRSQILALDEAERMFIIPKKSAGQPQFGPLLEDFDSEISAYRVARDNIQSLPDLQRCKWIEVDFRPIKQVLNAYALKWMWTFTKYLMDQASTTLKSLDSFLKKTEPQIENITGEERDTGSFMKMMRVFNEVSSKQVEMEVQFAILQKTVALLGKHNTELPAESDTLFRTMPARWNSLKTKVSLAKQRLGPRIQQEADRVTKDLEIFQHKLDTLGACIESSQMFMYSFTPQRAFEAVQSFSLEVRTLQNEAKDLRELQELLESTVVDFSILQSCEELLRNLRLVWQNVHLIHKEQNTWKKELWQNMDTNELYKRTSQQLKDLQSLPGEVHDWDVYIQALEAVNAIHLTLPLIDDLSNRAMRTRHWKQLVRETGGMLRVTAESLKAMTLGDLLELDLQKHTGDVRTTVQRAMRDVTIESALKNCEEVWLSRIFDLRPHSRIIAARAHNEETASSISGSHQTKADLGRNFTTSRGSRRLSRQSDKALHLVRKGAKGSALSLYESLKNIEEHGTVMLLSSTKSVFEELEHHQLVLTNMQPYAEAGAFLDEVTKWQRKLQGIETTVQLWILVQEKWTQLEEVFSTLTFRVAMPRETVLFADVHHHFCRLMKAVEGNPNILQNCMRRGLQSLLDQLNYKLERCQKAVRHFLEQKRLAFPRFFFLSLEDTLNIVCYGYDLGTVSTYLVKVFQYVHSLIYHKSETSSEHDCPKILGIRSFIGEELCFVEPLECRGPVESWLPQLVNSIKASLQHHLRAALEHTQSSKQSRREIHSAGARRVVINRPASKQEIAADRKKSLTSSMKTESGGAGDHRSDSASRNFILNTQSDVSYLSTQIHFSRDLKKYISLDSECSKEKIQGCLKDLTEGIEYAAKILNEIPQKDIRQHSKRTSEAEREGNGQGESLHESGEESTKEQEQEMNPQTNSCPLSAGGAIKLSNHILLLLYQREVLEQFLSTSTPVWKVSQPLCYDYDSDTMNITVKIGEAEICYGYEYQGCAEHQLITPLTERAFLNVMAAVSSGVDALCINSQVPGKISTVQQLCLALGKPLFNFNFTKTTDYRILQDIAKGLAAAGAWICLNGLEQLQQSSLAMLAQLLGQIQSARHYGRETVTLQLEEVPLNTAGACIAVIKRSTNDILQWNNYPESCKLPSALLNCFRIVGVSDVPVNYFLEAQLLLKGFSHVAFLAQKLSVMLKSFAKICKPSQTGAGSSEIEGMYLCSSVAGINALLNEARCILRALQENNVEKHGQDLENTKQDLQLGLEDRALVIAIHHCWLPQLSVDKAHVFEALLAAEWPNTYNTLKYSDSLTVSNDFDGLIPAVIAGKYGPGQQVPSSECTEETSVPSAIKKAAEKCHIYPSKAFVSKVSHLVQLAPKHQTVVVTGPPGCGKTECIKAYVETLRQMGTIVTRNTVFINALQPGHLLGFMNEDSRWNDGLLTELLRNYCHEPSTTQVDIVHLDGELDTLADVSPAVLCCMGILSITCTDQDWKLPLRMWIKSHTEEWQQLLNQLSEMFLEPSLKFLREKQIIHQQEDQNRTQRAAFLSEANVVQTFCKISKALIQHVPEMLHEDVKKYFMFACIWSFGGWLDFHEQSIFSNWWRQAFRNHSTFPVEGQVWDYHIDTETRQFVRWHDTLSSYSVSHGQNLASEAFVQTVHNEQLLYLSSLLTMSGCPVMLAGNAGCGKTAIMEELLNSLCSGDVAEVLELRIPINSSTDPRRLWGCLRERLEWRHGTLHTPAGNKKLLCLLDDLNLAKVDVHGRRPACEFVRQLIDQERIFDPSSLKWKTIQNITYLATWNLNTMERFPSQSHRLLRHFCVFHCQYPSQNEQLRIFTTILNTHFLPPVAEFKAGSITTAASDALQGLLTSIATVSIELQERLRTVFLRTSQRCHYIFTLRDLSKIFRNICLSLDGSTTSEKLLGLWRHECDWVYGYKMSSSVDYNRYHLEYAIAAKKVFTKEEELQIILSPQQPLFSNIVEDDGGLITTVAKQQDMNLSRRNEKTSSGIHTLDGYQQTFNLVYMKQLLTEALRECNKANPRMNITFYKHTIDIMCRLTRNLQSSHGSAHTMLCGDGCPRISSSLARLAAHLSGFSVVQIGSRNKAHTEDQRTRQFKSQLVDCYVNAGLKGQRSMILLSEEEIDSTALVFMTEFVVFGSVSHLFTSEQQATIANAMRSEVTNAGLTYSKESAWNLFLQSVQQNTRWFLVCSNTGSTFYKWCLEFSSLINAVNVYFIPHWSREELVENASYHIQDLEMLTTQDKENICHLLASMHLSIIKNEKSTQSKYGNITNANYENFAQCFRALMKEQYAEVMEKHELANTAFDHISEKLKSHEKLTDDLRHQIIVLEEHKEGTLKILHQIAQDKAVVEQKIQIVHQQLQKIKKFQKLLPEYQLAHEKAQYKCSAIVEDIKELVKQMDINALGELRAMQKPDVNIEELMASVIIILKSPNTDLTWAKGAKRQMANIDRFLNELIDFSNTQIPQSTLELLETNINKAQFTPENMERKAGGNIVAGTLLRWLQGAVRYYRILSSKVKPLRSKVEEITVALEEAEQKMTTLQQKKKALIFRLSDLEKGFEEATVHKNKQQQRAIEISQKLEQAASIAQLLEEEREKYSAIMGSLPERLSGIPGTTAMAAGLVSYLGAYEHLFRQLMLTVEWPKALKERGFPLMVDSIDPVKGRVIELSVMLTCDSSRESKKVDENKEIDQKDDAGEESINEVCISDYPDQEEANRLLLHNRFSPVVTEELYEDYVKALLLRIVKAQEIQAWTAKDWTLQQMENAAILSFSWQRPVLLIDPCFEGEKWVLEIIQGHLEKTFSSINFQARQDSSVLAPIEKAIMSGCPLILHNYCSKWDDLLMPLIDHCSATAEKSNNQESSSIISFNGHRLLCSDQFRLYLAASDVEPHLNIDISSGATIINYSPSEGSLLELLLKKAFAKLQPDLHCQLMDNAKAIKVHQQSLEELEKKTRDCFISPSLNNMVDTVTITNIFNEKKRVSKELEKAKSSYIQLMQVTDKLYPLAQRGALFFSILKSLRSLSAEYSFSLDVFLKLFDAAIGANAGTQGDIIQMEKNGFKKDSEYAPSNVQDTDPKQQSTMNQMNNLSNESNEVQDTMPAPRGRACSMTAEQYFSLPSNQIRKLMDQLTQAVYQTMIQSLLPEHSVQACAFLFLCVQELENENAFTEEEFAFFAQGSGALRKTGKKWEELDCNLSPPSWLPLERWDNLKALSMLSGSLRLLCTQITENSADWEKWYNSEYTEEVNKDIAAYLPEIGDPESQLSEFHQLLVLRALQPEQFPAALSRYVQNVSTDLEFDSHFQSIHEIARLEENTLGVLLIMPPTNSNKSIYGGAVLSHESKIAVCSAAKEKGIPLFIVGMKNGNEAEVKAALNDTMNQNGWLIVENLQIASRSVLKNLFKSLTYATKMRVSQTEERQFCVWLTSEPGASIPQGFLAQLKKVSWHYLLSNQISRRALLKDLTYIDSFPGFLSSAILSALDQVEEKAFEKLKGKSVNVQKTCFGICVLHGILQTQKVFPNTGLNCIMDMGPIQLNQAVDVVLSTSNNMKTQDDFADAVEESINTVYSCLTWRREERAYVQALVHEIISSILEQKDSLIIGNFTIPLPPANVEPPQYSSWLINHMPEKYCAEELLLPWTVEKAAREAYASEFMIGLAAVYDAMDSPLPLLTSEGTNSTKDMTLLRSSIDMVSEQLPTLIQTDTVQVSINDESGGDLETSKHVLSQECDWMNTMLKFIKHSVSELSKFLLAGVPAIPESLRETAEALHKAEVPKSWLYTHSSHTASHTISSWLQDLHKRHKQLKQWAKKGLMPFAKGENGALTSIYLGGLFNPEALFLALRVEFAVHHGYSLHEVVLQCHIAEYPDYKPDTEGYQLYLESLTLQGAEWDFKNNHLKESRSTAQPLPFVIITPAFSENVKPNEDGTDIYECPVYMDSTMQCFVMKLPLLCTKPAQKWHLRRVAIILSPEVNTSKSWMLAASATEDQPIKHQTTNTLTKMDKSSHSEVPHRASKEKDSPGGQLHTINQPISTDVEQCYTEVVADNVPLDNAHEPIEQLQHFQNEITEEYKDAVLSPLFIDNTISNQIAKEIFKENKTSADQKLSFPDSEDSEGEDFIESEGAKEEQPIIRADSMVLTKNSDYEDTDNENSHGHNNGNFDETENKGYKEDFDKDRRDSFDESLHGVNDYNAGENQDSYNYGWNIEDNNEEDFDYNNDGRYVTDGKDNTVNTRGHSGNSKKDAENPESIRDHVGTERWDNTKMLDKQDGNV
ncbi:uncharacterized protein O3C94_002925 [Discoglossus pictus]